ncbi:MAG TPA: LysR family transcriptional regulator [Ktedonobacteraceae bacterium]|jgi:DNA-binding transcriptional LysR family regulator|nr:LysR family transcriptional regulator [Ktedonobacteraceae bacterium]
MELRHLRYFVTVAEELHFGHAAQRLRIAQPPLSQQIRQLEEELGVQLFLRTRRSVSLTEAGVAFLVEAQRVLEQAKHAIEVAQRTDRGERGQLIIGFVGSATYGLLPKLLHRFRERFPDVTLVLHELTTGQQIQALHEQRIHLGVLRHPVAQDSLMTEAFTREALIVALPEQHHLATQKSLSLSALAGEPFVLFPRHLGAGLYDHILSLCQQAGFSPRVTQEAIQMQTMVGLVAAGFGICLVPASLQQLRQEGVVYCELNEAPACVELALAWRRDDTTPVLCTFLDLVREALATTNN